MASKRLVVADENEGRDAINIQIKVAGVNLSNLKSTGKVFHLGGSEYSMSRFGSWAIQEIDDENELAALLTDGGVVAAITWAIWTKYREVSIWVTNVHDFRFTLDVKKSQKKGILEEIGSGQMAKNLEEHLKTCTVAECFKKLKVKLVKIIQETEQRGKRQANDYKDDYSEEARIRRIIEAERVANLMAGENYSWAFMLLKRSLQDEKDGLARLQMLMRLSICAVCLKNFDEMEGAFLEIIKLMKKVDIPADEMDFYREEYDRLFKFMLLANTATRAIEISFAFLEFIKKMTNADERLDEMTAIICRICKSIDILLVNDGACLKSEVLRNMEKLSENIDFLQRQNDCDSLKRAQCIYYAEYHLSMVKGKIGKRTTELFGKSTMEFSRLSSCWADLPFVVTRLRLHPATALYLQDEKFQESIREISKNPAVLQHKIKDPKIAHANEVLTSDFGLFTAAEDIENAFAKSGMKPERPDPSDAADKQEEKRPVDKRAQATKEKDLGNEAYKKKQFQKALYHYDKAISLDPTDAMLHSNKAAVYISQQRLDLARSSCLTAISLTQRSNRHDNKDVAKITARLGRIELLEGNADIALTLYQRSLRLNFDEKVRDQMKECQETLLAERFMRHMHSPFF